MLHNLSAQDAINALRTEEFAQSVPLWPFCRLDLFRASFTCTNHVHYKHKLHTLGSARVRYGKCATYAIKMQKKRHLGAAQRTSMRFSGAQKCSKKQRENL